MSVVLWPRQEVLQLVITQLSSAGRVIQPNTLAEIAKKLIRSSVGGKISLHIWLYVAKEVLTWSDQCIYLFWEMLLQAIFYLSSDLATNIDVDQDSVDIECILVFLILHIADVAPAKTGISATHFDSVWPLNADGEVYPSSPTASPSSPTRESNRVHRALSPIGSPRSPRGAMPQSALTNNTRSSIGGAINSASSPRTPRISTQHLHSVRQKIPMMLRVLSWCSMLNIDEDIAAFLAEDPRRSTSETTGERYAFEVDRRTADFLGMIICGGYSRDQNLTPFSTLHPTWASEGNNETNTTLSTRSLHDAIMMDSTATAVHTVMAGDLVAWINLHLAMNDVLYPVTLTPSGSTVAAAGAGAVGGGIDSMDSASKDNMRSHQPHKVATPVQSLTRFNPTVINNSSTTIIHVVTVGVSRASSFRQRSATSTTNNKQQQAPQSQDNNRRSPYDDRMDVTTTPQHHSRQVSASNIDAMITELGSPNSADSFGLSAADALMMDQDIAPSPTLPWSKMKVDGSDTSDADVDVDDDDDSSQHTTTTTATTTAAVAAVGSAGSAGGMTTNTLHAVTRPDLTLPQLYINYCKSARLYMISPYYSASITGCVDSTIIVGAVYGALIMNGCERVKVTAACRKAIIINCLECEINLATMSHTIVMGDSRSLTFGPHNVAYRNLKHHLRMAELNDLSKSSSASQLQQAQQQQLQQGDEGMHTGGTTAARTNNALANNCWAQVCDVNACLELTMKTSLGSPKLLSSLAMEQVIPRHSRFAAPMISTAVFLGPERYKYVTIPVKGENVAFDRAAIPIPAPYLEQLRYDRERMDETKTKLLSLLDPVPQSSSAAQMMTADDNNPPEDEKVVDPITKLLASSALSKKFMDWLIATENIQEVLDLIRIDSERPTSAAMH